MVKMGDPVCWLRRGSVKFVNIWDGDARRVAGMLPEVDIIIELAPRQSDHVTDNGNRLWSQRRLARVMAKQFASGEVSKSDNANRDEEQYGIACNGGHDDGFVWIGGGKWMMIGSGMKKTGKYGREKGGRARMVQV
jgi:hypothetical protein